MEVHPTVTDRPEPWPLGSAQVDVQRFHELTDLPVRKFPPRHAAGIHYDTLLLRARLIHEEANETIRALGFEPGVLDEPRPQLRSSVDIVGVADGIADAIFVLLGTAVSLGINIAPVWREVQRSNMTKIDPATGRARKRDDGKILKPPTFSPADVNRVIEDQVIAGEYEEATRLRDESDRAAGR